MWSLHRPCSLPEQQLATLAFIGQQKLELVPMLGHRLQPLPSRQPQLVPEPELKLELQPLPRPVLEPTLAL